MESFLERCRRLCTGMVQAGAAVTMEVQPAVAAAARPATARAVAARALARVASAVAAASAAARVRMVQWLGALAATAAGK